MIEPRQIRAARALLNWSQTDLAKASGVATSSIKNIENEITVARRDTLSQIVEAFESNGVEFFSDGGVRPRHREVRVLKGTQGFKDFFDDVYQVVQKGGEICVSGIDESIIGQALDGYGDIHIKRMSEIKASLKVKCLVKEGDRNFTAKGYCEYKWVVPELFETTHFYVYNDRVAIISILSVVDINIVVIDIPKVAEFYEKLFLKMWEEAKIPE